MASLRSAVHRPSRTTKARRPTMIVPRCIVAITTKLRIIPQHVGGPQRAAFYFVLLQSGYGEHVTIPTRIFNFPKKHRMFRLRYPALEKTRGSPPPLNILESEIPR